MTAAAKPMMSLTQMNLADKTLINLLNQDHDILNLHLKNNPMLFQQFQTVTRREDRVSLLKTNFSQIPVTSNQWIRK